MTTYGPEGAATGQIAFSGWSFILGGTTGNTDAQVPAASGMVQFNGLTQSDRLFSKLARRNRTFRNMLLAVIGASSGTSFNDTYSRVQAQQALNSITTNGGLVPVESYTETSRNTTNTDISNAEAVFNTATAPSSYAVDASGNGGGGKSGF